MPKMFEANAVGRNAID